LDNPNKLSKGKWIMEVLVNKSQLSKSKWIMEALVSKNQLNRNKWIMEALARNQTLILTFLKITWRTKEDQFSRKPLIVNNKSKTLNLQFMRRVKKILIFWCSVLRVYFWHKLCQMISISFWQKLCSQKHFNQVM